MYIRRSIAVGTHTLVQWRKEMRGTRFSILALLMVFSLLLASCGGESPTATPQAAAPTEAATAAAVADTPTTAAAADTPTTAAAAETPTEATMAGETPTVGSTSAMTVS